MPKKATSKKNGGGTATEERPEGAVEELPKGRELAKDGTIILKQGMHEELPNATYEVHGARLTLDGKVFVAAFDVNWIPTNKCGSCKTARPGPVTLTRLASGHFAMHAQCSNKKCQYGRAAYLWITPGDRFTL